MALITTAPGARKREPGDTVIFSDFAYTRAMQAILFVVTSGTTFFNAVLMASFLFTLYGEKLPWKNKLMFGLLAGFLLNNLWTYGIYLLGGAANFSPLLYALVTVPNPVFALLYYLIGVHALRMPRYTAVRGMRYVYLSMFVVKMIRRLVGQVFFVQTDPLRYNYMLDTVSLLVNTAVIYAVYRVALAQLRKRKTVVRIPSGQQMYSIWRELCVTLLVSVGAYIFAVVPPFFVHAAQPGWGDSLCTFMQIVVYMISVAVVIWFDYASATHHELENKDVYISSLTRAIDGFHGIKHDIYNVLHTYSGYLQLGDHERLRQYHNGVLGTALAAGSMLDFSRHMQQNPALIALLMQKEEQARASGVSMRTAIQCDVGCMYIGDADLCQVLSALLDSAIQRARVAASPRVSLSIEQKLEGGKLIVISGEARDAGETVPLMSGHRNGKTPACAQEEEIRNTIGRYGNCMLGIARYQQNVTVYLELNIP